MKSHTTERFRKAFKKLPIDIQRQAREAYRLFMHDPNHPGLHFSRVHPSNRLYSVRIGLDYRAVGVRDRDEVVWFWIGSHEEYDKLLSQL